MKKVVFFLLFISTLSAFSQEDDTIKIEIKLVFNNNPIVLGDTYISNKNDTLRFESIKFYLSSFELKSKENTIVKETNSYHLIDIEEPESLNFKLKTNSLDKITTLKFNIGVDSLASVSGAMQGDLDATKGMYWAWQSGFINMKIEGNSNSCKTRKNKFHFHVGGYLEPNYAMRELEIPITISKLPNQTQKKELNLVIDLAKLFDEIQLSQTNSIMIPGKEAMKIADLSSKIFSLE